MLPQPPTSFVGRENELAEARRLLTGSRLLTLTGPGGAGKTRLATELARRTEAEFTDGAVFVDLAPVRDPALVPVLVAGALGLQDSRGTALLDHLVANLSGREVLLVLDNMEQVLEAGGFVAALLAATDAVHVLVTSRAPLHLTWEQEMPVPPLSEAIQLFADRASASVPGFAVTDGNADTVGRIAERLDGLPLAIELAAARVRVLPPEAILERLDDSLALLVSDYRDVPDRQRTLRATIAWSHELLSEPAQRLFTVCSVFRGGIDLSVLGDVCSAADLGGSVLDPLTELVDHSLLRRTDDGQAPRFAMLETVREFAAEQFADATDLDVVRDAHSRVFLRLVEHLALPPAAPDRAGLDALELEHDNLRAALDHLSESEPGTALRAANRLTGFWSIRGHFSEGRQRLAALRDLVPDHDPEWADALFCEAWLATDQGDRGVALPLLELAVERARAGGDQVPEAEALLSRGRARLVIGDPSGGWDDIERSLALREASGDPVGLAGALWLGGAAAHFHGDVVLAAERLGRSVALSTDVGLTAIRARALQLLGVVHLDLDDRVAAEAALSDAVPAASSSWGDRFAIPIGLSALAALAARRGRPRSALRLAGAAAAFERVNQTDRPQFVRALLGGSAGPGFRNRSAGQPDDCRTRGLVCRSTRPSARASTRGPRTRGVWGRHLGSRTGSARSPRSWLAGSRTARSQSSWSCRCAPSGRTSAGCSPNSAWRRGVSSLSGRTGEGLMTDLRGEGT